MCANLGEAFMNIFYFFIYIYFQIRHGIHIVVKWYT